MAAQGDRSAIGGQTSARGQTRQGNIHRNRRVSGLNNGGARLAPAIGHDDLQSDSLAHVARPGPSREHGRHVARCARRLGPGRAALQAPGTRAGPVYRRPACLSRMPRLRCEITRLGARSEGAASPVCRRARPFCTLRVGHGPSSGLGDLYRQAQPGPIHPGGWLSQTGCSPCSCSRPTTNTDACRLTGRRRRWSRRLPRCSSPPPPFDSPARGPYRGAPQCSEHS